MHWRRAAFTASLVIVLTLAAALLWRTVRNPNPASGTPISQIATGLSTFPLGQRPLLPPISGKLLDGRSLNLIDYRGRVVVINLWGSWCAPCRAEAPDLVRVANATKRAGVRFVGIDTRDAPASAEAFVRRFHVPYPSYDDQDGRVLSRFGGIVPISAVPSTVVVDRTGRVAARVVGRIDETTLRGLVADVLAEPSGEP